MSWDLKEFAKSRYQLLGNGSHWFPGNNSNLIDVKVSESQLLSMLEKHINPELVLNKLRVLKEEFGGKSINRLTTS